MPSVLHVDLQVRPGAEKDLEETFRSTFRPAIEVQEGFRSVRLLCPADAPDYRLVIEFTEEERRQRWVASDLHQRVWPQLEQHCDGSASHLYSAPAD